MGYLGEHFVACWHVWAPPVFKSFAVFLARSGIVTGFCIVACAGGGFPARSYFCSAVFFVVLLRLSFFGFALGLHLALFPG